MIQVNQQSHNNNTTKEPIQPKDAIIRTTKSSSPRCMQLRIPKDIHILFLFSNQKGGQQMQWSVNITCRSLSYSPKYMMAEQIFHIVFHFPQKDMKNSTSLYSVSVSHSQQIDTGCFERTTVCLVLSLWRRTRDWNYTIEFFWLLMSHDLLVTSQLTILYYKVGRRKFNWFPNW